jgi:hypothetical protein
MKGKTGQSGGDAMEELKSFLYSTGRPNDGADAATIELISAYLLLTILTHSSSS